MSSRGVALARQKRSYRPTNNGVRRKSYPYALSGITYCAHCEQLTKDNEGPRLRSRIGGKGARRTSRDVPRYRHKQGVQCGSNAKLVPCEVYEADFIRLIRLLTVKPEYMDRMAELAVWADSERFGGDVDMQKQKEEAIALCKRRIEAAVQLYKDGRISRAEYLRIVETNEREIVHWESHTLEGQKLAYELALCWDAIDRLLRKWADSEPEDRRGLAQSLFDYIVHDLDARRIVDFRLKPWADKYLTLFAGLYQVEGNENPPRQEVGTAVPPRGLEPLFQP